MYPSSCDTFVALPPSTEKQCIIFGKNSDRPCDEVQEVVYYPARDYGAGEKVECTYIEIEQVAHTYAVVLSKPAWLWGAEMGANEHQVCIGNEAVWGRESADGDEALLGMDLVRIGLERANAAEEAVDVITELLEKYGQGGSCMEDESNFTYHNSFLISDRKEAWLLETSGKHWAAERVKGGYRNISNQYSITTKIDKEHPALREYAQSQGWWDGETRFNFSTVYSFMTTARIEASGSRYCEGKKLLKKSNGVHYFTATPDPERSVFKPFIFVKNVNELKETSSPSYGADDPVKKKPRFQSKPDRKHLLFVKHELDKGKKITESLRKLEKDKMTKMETFLSNGIEEPDLLADLFTSSVREEMAVYGNS
ncbi:Secernin-3 [Liparis tanakae]|uniref:Secernin-3 n=1 Tax=Liparis tanakae TaxID=230148 RepID=A0A4Z2GLQ1_9TELE|nr:Secernin-3 [Liparis tanakae]